MLFESVYWLNYYSEKDLPIKEMSNCHLQPNAFSVTKKLKNAAVKSDYFTLETKDWVSLRQFLNEKIKRNDFVSTTFYKIRQFLA